MSEMQHMAKIQLCFLESSCKLKIGRWKSIFESYLYKVLICKALNHCSKHDGLRLAGYLITNNEVYLVPNNSPEEMEEIINILNYQMKKGLEKELKWRKSFLKIEDQLLPLEVERSIYQDKIFEYFPLIDFDLIHLLIGENIEKEYYQPKVKRLMDLTENNNFCSVPFYLAPKFHDIIGPVDLWHYKKQKLLKK